MARTKQVIRRRAPPASPSPSTSNVSPIFSAQASVASGETPATSDGEVEIKTTRASSKRKAAVIEVESKIEEEEVETEGRPVRKRRATTRTAYVEIPYSPLSGKGKATKSAAPATTKGKGRARAKSPVVVESASSELSDDEDPIIEESEDSGSEFQASEAEDDVVDSSEDEAIMLAAAVEMSINSSRTKVASSSAIRLAPVNPEAAKRAAAAERRLSRRQQKMDVDDAEDAEDMDDSPAPPDDMGWGSASEEEANSSGAESDEPLSAKKGKGKGKAKAPAKAKAAPAPVPLKPPQHMTLAELRKWKREQRRAAQSAKRANKAEEQALRRKLGRKLTQGEKNQIALEKHHPELVDVWGDVEASIPIVKPTVVDQPADLKLTLLPFQRESLSWMQKQEQGIWHGGMLADEMGMGKTIQMIALFLSDKAKPNLVIAPTVAIMQWRNELTTHTDSLKVLVWHGASRESNIKELKKYDVVLTTYAVLESCFRKQHSGFKRKGLIVKEKSPIHEVNWHRIVLDEAHNIKERSTNTARAAFNLKSNYKWCLSGTPLQNRVGELYSLVRFLGGDPFSYYFCKQCDCKSLHWKFTDKRTCDDCGHSPMQHTCFWNNEILTPIQKFGMAGTGRPAFKKLKILLDRVMLRRTKLQRADDLGLPPRTVIVRRDYFSPEEKELYLSLFSDAKRQFTTYLDQGTVLNNYSNIFSLLTRMRQMACHPDLVIRSKTNASKFIEDVGEATVCRLCNDIAEDAIQSKCRHIFDRECIKQYLEAALEHQPACPVCHLPLTIDLEAPALEINENIDPAAHARQGILGRLNLDTWRSSTKIEALVEELTNLRKTESTTKSIVFSQFVNFLDLIAFRLQRAGFNICRLEGTMSPQARDATIQHFMNNVDVTVFLVSLKAGGVALNLTEASRVYLMDSWWNPAVEYQAMDRIHRLGQKRPVQAIKLVVEDSIESRIVQLQEKKSAMVDATLSTDDSAMGRLTPEDLGFLFRL